MRTKMKRRECKYRGIKWKNDSDLSLKLGKCRAYVYQNKKLGKTYEEIIDKVLEFRGEYRGIKWKNDSDLSVKLGKERKYVNTYKRRGETYKQIIDRVLSRKKAG